MREPKVLIDDIMKSIAVIEKYATDSGKEEFLRNTIFQDAITRRLEIIGEAIKGIPEDFRKKYPEVEWKKAAGLRDIIIHAYANIDLVAVWSTIVNKIPELKRQILEIKRLEKW